MSCNPAIGGVAKGHLVKEIDALGGEMASVIDATGIQFRRLNASKGPAVRSTRAQADKRRYRDEMRGGSSSRPASRCARARSRSSAIVDASGAARRASSASRRRWACATARRAVILTTGTFLRGAIFVGEAQRGGRPRRRGAGDRRCRASLDALGFPLARLKTGTPCRLDRKHDRRRRRSSCSPATIRRRCSAWTRRRARPPLPQLPCWITYTNERTHDDHPRRPARARRCIAGQHRGHRAALLPEHRGQGRPVRGQGPPPDLPRAGGHRHRRGLSERHLDLAAVRRAARVPAHDPGPRARAR